MEITASALQTVADNGKVIFTETPVSGNCSILHREGSGVVNLRGLGQQSRARFRVSFGANVAIPTGGTVQPIRLAITVDGEPEATSTMIVTPAAVEEFFNVYSSLFLDVHTGCCEHVSVTNISEEAISVQNANFIIERVA